MERIRSNRQQQRQQQQRFCRRLTLVGSRRRVFLLLVLLAWCSWSTTTVVEAKRKTPPETITQQKPQPQAQPQEPTDPITGVPFLVEMLGKELYSYLDRPKYRLYLRMTVGKLPNEETFVVSLNMICNLLYGVAILVGFLLLPRGFMLLGTLATIFVGPALVLILLGSTALVAAAFALYPVASVLTLWLFFFLDQSSLSSHWAPAGARSRRRRRRGPARYPALRGPNGLGSGAGIAQVARDAQPGDHGSVSGDQTETGRHSEQYAGTGNDDNKHNGCERQQQEKQQEW